jgi:hypothetical protein
MTTIYLFIYKSLSLLYSAATTATHVLYYCLAKSQTLIDRDFLRYLKTKIVPKLFILASRRILDDYNQSTGIATDTTASHSVSQSETDCVVPPFPPPESSRVLSLLLLLLLVLFCSAGCCKSSSSSSDFVCNTDSDTHSVRYDSPGLNGNNLLPSFPPSGVRTVSKTNARFENLCQEVQHLFLRSTVFS